MEKSDNHQKEFLTLNEVEHLLKVSLATLFHWRTKGILVPFISGGRVRYCRVNAEKLGNHLKKAPGILKH